MKKFNDVIKKYKGHMKMGKRIKDTKFNEDYENQLAIENQLEDATNAMVNIGISASDTFKFHDTVNTLKDASIQDSRYNQPKEDPKASYEQVEETIESTEIYKRAKELILKAQHRQVAYGLDKYPEPLNADTWSMLETIDHIIDESIDKLHYLVMLRIKLEKDAEKELDELKNENVFYIHNKPHYFDPEYGFIPVNSKKLYADGKFYGYFSEDDTAHDVSKKLTCDTMRYGNIVEVSNTDYDGNIKVSITVNSRDDDSIDVLTYSISELLRLNNKN